jgi:hypothetical protein
MKQAQKATGCQVKVQKADRPTNRSYYVNLPVVLARIFHTSAFGAPIFNRLSASSRPQSRLQVGAPDCWHFVRIMKYAG